MWRSRLCPGLRLGRDLYPLLSGDKALTAVDDNAAMAGLEAGATYLLPGLAVYL